VGLTAGSCTATFNDLLSVVSTVSIVMMISEGRRQLTIDYLCLLFVGDGVKRWPR
jgi:hypothetical protein